MKTFLLQLLFLLLTSLGANHAQSIKINVTLSDELMGEEQWVYWITLNLNNFCIEDSCFLAKDQKTFIFEKELGEKLDELTTSQLTFSQKGPIQAEFFPSPGENIQINLNEKTSIFIDAEGSIESREYYQITMGYEKVFQTIRRLKESLSTTPDSIALTQLNDSIEYYNEYAKKGFWLDTFNKTTTNNGSNTAFMFLHQAMPDETLDSLYTVLKKRFPESKWVKAYYDPAPPATPQGKLAQKRIEEIRNARMKKINPNFQPPTVTERKDYSKDLEGIIAYKIGDVIDTLSLKGLTGSEVSLRGIATPYLLIDFWAGWCGPCRREFPNVKQAHNNYKEALTVYAISLDSNEENWKKTIEEDKIQQFTHVYGGDWGTFETQKLTKRFGVKGIPANFLLDKDRKIIATNLRGNALEEKMKELMNK